MSESFSERLSKQTESSGCATDFELALHWIKEMIEPCADPYHPEINLGMKWYFEAKDALATMKAKPVEQQNQFAIKILQDGIQEFERDNNIK